MSARVALVVGIGQSEFRHLEYPPLKYCSQSARDVFELLTLHQYGGCDPDRSQLLNDEKGEKITPDVLGKAVEELLATIEIDDLFLFYFCGHGDLSGSNLFLMTTGAKQAQDGYGIASLLTRLGQKELLNVLLIVDACFSRAMFNSVRYWGQDRMPDNLGQIASAGYMKNAWEDEDRKRTRFSYYFCEGIRTGCPGYDSKDKSLITIDPMTEYINNQMACNYGEYAQKAEVFSMGDQQQLWIARRKQKAYAVQHQKPMYSFAKIIETFQRDYIYPAESDRAVEYMRLIRQNLNIPPEKMHIRNRIEERIDRLIPLILSYRSEDRERSTEAKRQKARISANLDELHRDLEAAKG